MLTADQYRESIRDGRASYLEGHRVVDPVTHPLLRVSVDGGELRAVWQNDDGVVLRGAKQHVLGAAVVHELCVVPSGPVREEDASRAIACAVPVNSPGLKVVSITTAPRAEDPRHFPISS